MIRTKLMRATVALTLMATLPATAMAQDTPATPEGVEWHLTTYADGSGMTAVPWSIDATLLLEDGTASGSNGCNHFSGDYELVGEELTFGDTLGVTLMACLGDPAAVEAGYMAAVAEVTTWAMEEDELQLSDADGKIALEFDEALIGLTASDIAAIEALFAEQRKDIDRLEERVDSIRIGVLRDRIKALEASAAAARSSGPDISAFNAAEKVLLGAVRKDIAETCEPRRSQNPAGTIAALQCKPNAPEVADMAYYLMESDDAWKVYRKRMKDNKVKNGTEKRACAFGKPSQMAWVGGGFVNAGCYRNEDGRANLRFVNTLAECRQLTAGSTQVKNPSIYIAVLGPDRDIASLYQWAASSTEWEAGEDLFDSVKQAGQPWSDQCPHG